MNEVRGTVIITTHDSAHYLKRLLESMDAFNAGCDFELFVADNASTDGTAELLKKEFEARPNFKRLHLSKDNLWDHCIYNQWIPSALTEYILFLNADVRILRDGWLISLIEEMEARSNPVGLLGLYAGECEKITPMNCPFEMEWIRDLYVKRIGLEFDNLGHVHQSMFFARKTLFDVTGLFKILRVLSDRPDNIASEIEFSVRLREAGYAHIDSSEMRSHFYHFGQRFPCSTYEEILEREKSLRIPELP